MNGRSGNLIWIRPDRLGTRLFSIVPRIPKRRLWALSLALDGIGRDWLHLN